MALDHRQITVVLFTGILCLNAVMWLSFRDIQKEWGNIPPVPSQSAAVAVGLGDKEFAYRTLGVMLQSFGDTGGRSISFNEYNYEELTKWLFLMDYLNQKSIFIPNLAAFYFGSVQNGEKLRPMMDFFLKIGTRNNGERWKYLVHGVYLARYEMNDLDKALEMAGILAKSDNDEMPAFARQLAPIIMNVQGKQEAAYSMMVELLKSEGHKMQQAEINTILLYICNEILDEAAAATDPLCENISSL